MNKKLYEYSLCLDESRNPIIVKEKSFPFPESPLNSPEKISSYLNNCCRISQMAEEHVYMLAFNMVFHPIGIFEVSHGCINASCCSPREIFQRALFLACSNIVVIHNHPSGCCTPSEQDRAVCKRLIKAGNILNVTLNDFIIIGEGTSYCSFRDEYSEYF